MIITCIDFETTGTPSPDDRHAVIEAGLCNVLDGPTVGNLWATLCRPNRPIPPEASAVHHITDAMLENAGPIEAAFRTMVAEKPDYWCAHQADFERAFFSGGDTPWICTYKVALRLWPDAPSHSLQALRYFLPIPVDPALCWPPHRAGPDAYLGASLMAHILRTRPEVTISEMVHWSSGPALLPRINFGKHKGSKWEELPTDYLEWLVGPKAADVDRDAKANAKYHLRKRDEERKARLAEEQAERERQRYAKPEGGF